MQALQTRHNQHLFRSRLEARWAVFFEALSIPYLYEPEGFDLEEAGRYLPDFFLPGIPSRNWPVDQKGIWVEIKPYFPDKEYLKKLEALVEHTHHKLLLLCGGVSAVREQGLGFSEFWWDGDEEAGFVEWDDGMAWHKCYSCGQVKLDWGDQYEICGICGGHSDSQNPELLHAVTAARSMRFEGPL